MLLHLLHPLLHLLHLPTLLLHLLHPLLLHLLFLHPLLCLRITTAPHHLSATNRALRTCRISSYAGDQALVGRTGSRGTDPLAHGCASTHVTAEKLAHSTISMCGCARDM
jgi:hypothetical protein